MYYRLVLSFVFVSLTWLTYAQNKVVLEAQTSFDSGRYCEAAEKCGLAYTKMKRKGNQAKKLKADMAFKTAESYRFTDRFREANEWYDRALLLDYQEVVPEVLYYNGEMLRMMGDFDKALKNYEEYKKLVPSDERADTGIQSCNGSKNFVANKTKHVVTNQTAINKPEFDMSPMFQDRKETKMFFASSRTGSTGNEKDQIACENYMDIWVSEVDKKGNWGEPRLIDNSGLINTEAHEGSVAFGSVLNTNQYELLITANTSHGNSGGPLVDNEGKVVGTVSWSSTKEQYNGAMSLNAMCRKIIECDGKYYWKFED